MKRSLLLAVLCGVVLVARATAQDLTVTTIAGQFWESGSVDGTGRSARFNYPRNVVIDPAGNLYILDGNNYTLRKMTAGGVVTTIAGSPGAKSYVDGPGPTARFFQPAGLARDSLGNLYVSDFDLARGGGVVRKVSPAGVVSTHLTHLSGNVLAVDAYNTLLVGGGTAIRTFAVNGSEIFRDWPANLPTPGGVPRPPAGDFGTVTALAIDRAGNVYIADFLKHEIRKVTPARTMTVLAGGSGSAGYVDGTGTSARFNFPGSLDVDSAGNVYVADSNNHVLRKITPAGVVTTVLGAANQPALFGSDGRVAFPDGVGGSARLGGPQAVGVGPDDAVYLMDLNAVRKATGVNSPAKVVTPPDRQILPAGERATFSVVTSGYPAVAYQWQRQPAGATTWSNLTDNAVYSGTGTATLIIAAVSLGMNGDRFRCVVSNSFGTDTSFEGQILVDSPVVVVPLRVSTFAGRAGMGGSSVDGEGAAARFYGPHGVVCDASGNVYVSELSGNLIRKISANGLVTTLAGNGAAGTLDGVGRNAQFRQPAAIAIDPAGNLYVADRNFWPDLRPIIRKITPAGVVTTFAQSGPGGAPLPVTVALACDRAGNLILVGIPGTLIKFNSTGGSAPIPIRSTIDGATFSGGSAVAVDGADNLFIATGDQTVLKITPAGVLSTFAGRSGAAGAIDGRAANARFRGIQGIAVDAAGNVYVTDSGNRLIRKITPGGMVSTVAGIKPSAAMINPTGSADGLGTAVRFNQPAGIAFDRGGILYVADSVNHTVRRAVPVDAVAAGESAEFYVLSSGAEESAFPGEAGPASALEPRRTASGGFPTYQWFKDNRPISGAIAASFRIESAGVLDGGRYAVQVTTAEGAALSAPVDFAVRGSRLVNLSIRSRAGSGAQTLTVGFVVEGGGLPLLLRGVGPGLRPFGVSSPLVQPRLSLFRGEAAVVENSGWIEEPEMMDAAGRVGAFALVADSRDAVVYTRLESGAFTAQCAGENGGTGVALVELYDTSGLTTGRSRFVNASARSQVGRGDDVMIAGFAIAGSTPLRVLIRGVGPALAQFSVEGALADPQLKVFDGARLLRAESHEWSRNANSAEIAATTQGVGAFTLANNGRDAALLLQLAPGAYTVQLSGAGETTGVGLIEIYEVP